MRDSLAWETLDSKAAYSCEAFDVRHDEVRLPDGTDAEYDYVDEPPAVVVLPLTDDGEVVVIEEWRQAVDRTNRGLPAGTMESDDEDVAAAARRELAEETGYVADDVEPLVTVEPANGIANSVHHHVVATGCEPAGEQDLDRDESIRTTTMSFPAWRASVLAGEVRDGRAVVGTLFYDARAEG